MTWLISHQQIFSREMS